MTTSQIRVQKVSPILDLLDRMGLKDRASDLEDLILAYQESIATNLRLEATIHQMVKDQEKPDMEAFNPSPERMFARVHITGYPVFEFYRTLVQVPGDLGYIQSRMAGSDSFKKSIINSVGSAIMDLKASVAGSMGNQPCPDYSKVLK
jgi:hypothetical protein